MALDEATREEQKRAEKMAALASDMHTARVAAIRSETAKRLASIRRRAKEEERDRRQEMARKLADLARATGRSVPTTVILRGENVDSRMDELGHQPLQLQIYDDDQNDYDRDDSNGICTGGEDEFTDILENVTDEYIKMRERYSNEQPSQFQQQPRVPKPPDKDYEKKLSVPSTSKEQSSSSSSSSSSSPFRAHRQKQENVATNRSLVVNGEDELSDDSVDMSYVPSIRRMKSMEKLELAGTLTTQAPLIKPIQGPASPTISELTIGSPTLSRKSALTFQTGSTQKTKKSRPFRKLAPLPLLPYIPVPVKETLY